MGNRFPRDVKRVTIGDVATLAGVSKGTVSKVLNGGAYSVSGETRRRIQSAAHELDFRPNAIARDLARRRTETIGVIVASVSNPVYADLIAGIDRVLGESGFTLLFGSSEGSAVKEADVVRTMQQRRVDGIIMASVTLQETELEQLQRAGVDVVLASRNLPGADVDTVVVDNLDGARRAVAHLVEHGHTRVAHIAGPADVVPFVLRRQAFEEAAAAKLVDGDPGLVVTAPGTSHEAGEQALEQLLALDEPPTAVFAGSDGLALGVLEAAARHGLQVPRDLAVIGFDNTWIARMPGITLTTVDGKAGELGRRAALQLLERIEARHNPDEQQTTSDARTVVLPTTLVVRRSCGCD
jgi:LacI family transcriptional regulator